MARSKGGLGPASVRTKGSLVPGVIFTNPQISTGDLTEVQAREAGYDIKTSLLPVTAVPREGKL